MKKVIVIFIILSLSSCDKENEPAKTLNQESSSEFITKSEYFSMYPEQEQKEKLFDDIVQKPGIEMSLEHQKIPVKIIFISPGESITDFWRRTISSFEARMKEIKMNYQLTVYTSRPGSHDFELQQEQLEKSLRSDPDYLIYTIDILEHKELIERILTLGRPKLIMQNITSPLREWEGIQPFLYIGFSHKVGTETILAPYYLKLFKEKYPNAKYAMLFHTPGVVSDYRGKTFIQYMSERSEFNLVAQYYMDNENTDMTIHDASVRATFEIVKNHPDIKFIYACSTDIGLGVVDALKKLNLTRKILTNGWGGGSAELDSILKKELDFTVMRIHDDGGIGMATAIRLDMEGRADDIPQIYSGSFVLVTQDTPIEKIDEYKRRAFRYSGF